MSDLRAGKLTDWRQRFILLAVLLAVALSPSAAIAADDDDDLFSDDFLEEEIEESEETEKKDGPLLYWGFLVPVDVLASRPLAITNTIIGFGFFAPSAVILLGGGAVAGAVDMFGGADWYFDPGPVQTAWQICVQDPLDYAWNRPLGQLSSDF
jgi:hypothetical protein